MNTMINRRKFLQFSAGGAAVLAFGGQINGVAAQDATPTAAPVVTVTEGPGEDELTVVHAQGETVIKKNPEVIVSYDVAAIETIEFLGGSIAGVPELAGGQELSKTATETVGSMFEPDYEAVAALDPDLIIVAGRSAAVYPELAKIAPTIDISFGNDMMASFDGNSVALATIIGKEAEVQAPLDEAHARVDVLKSAAADSGTGMLVMVSAGSLTALAPNNAQGGRGALIYNVLGIQPPVEDLETATHGEPISFEFLLEHNPDWLFIIDRDRAVGEDGQPAEQVLDNDIIHQTAAWTEDQIVYLNPFDWYIITGASIPSMDRMLVEMETAFGI